MSKRDVRVFLQEILEAIDKVTTYIHGLDYQDFENNSLVKDAVIRNLEVIGEAANYVPRHLQERYSAIPWRRIVGFRNVAIHAYFAVDPAIVWRVCTVDLPELAMQMRTMLRELGNPPDSV